MTEKILEAVHDTQRRNWTKYITTDLVMVYLSRSYGNFIMFESVNNHSKYEVNETRRICSWNHGLDLNEFSRENNPCVFLWPA